MINWNRVFGGFIIVSPIVIFCGILAWFYGIVPVLMGLGVGIGTIGSFCLWFYGFHLWDKG